MKKLTIILVVLLVMVFAEPVTHSVNIETTDKNQTFVEETNPPFRSDLLFDQTPTGYNNLYACQWDSVMPFDAQVADNFNVPYDANVDSVVWWGGYWNPGAPGNIPDFWIEIFADSGSRGQPTQDPIYSERVSSYTETFIATDYYIYSAVIPPFAASMGETYWIEFMPTMVYPPQWGNNCNTPPNWGDGQEMYFKSVYFTEPLWVTATYQFGGPYESSFQIYGTAVGVEEGYTEISEIEHISFNSITSGRISFTVALSSPTNVEARIFDLTGRVVGTIGNRRLPAGENILEHSNLLSNGVYFVEVKVGDTSTMGKVLVVR